MKMPVKYMLSGLLVLASCASWSFAQNSSGDGITLEEATALAPASKPASAPAGEPADKEATIADYAALAKELAPSLARVEITLRFDKGEPPRAAGAAARWSGLEALVNEERPLELPGFVLTPSKVAVIDPVIHPRFVKSIAVHFGQQVVEAKMGAYGKDNMAIFLDLAKPLQGVKPLEFKPSKGPYLAVDYARMDGVWTVNIAPMPLSFCGPQDRKGYRMAPVNRLVVTEKGLPVALSMKSELPLDDSWQCSPQSWDTVSAAQMSDDLKALQDRSSQGLLRVALSFRSPRKGTEEGAAPRYGREEEAATERNVVGVLLDSKTVAVLTSLKRKSTARLESIRVYGPKGEVVTGRFAGTMSDYGCFLATLEKPLSGALAAPDQPILDFKNQMLFSVDLTLQGEKLVSYYDHNRFAGFATGWKGQIYPGVLGGGESLFLFDAKGRLAAMPLARRPKAGLETREEPEPILTPLSYLTTAMKDLAANADPSNIPLTEEQEDQLAWLGVILQPMNKELAREKNVSEQTQDGQTGGSVSYVYPGSPADKAGIKMGMILLRLHLKDVPKPVDIRLDNYDLWPRGFPWEHLSEMPENAYELVAARPPWPSAEDMINRTLTDHGIGKPYALEFFSDGKVMRKDFVVQQGPAHYNSAAKYKSKELGLTVRDITYELRRYFQKELNDPGVIISNEEPGSLASVAGIKPFEIITHIDGKPVMNVKDFQKLLKAQGEIRLSVKRMTKGREVKIDMGGKGAAKSGGEGTGESTTESAGQSTSEPASEPAAKSTPPETSPPDVE